MNRHEDLALLIHSKDAALNGWGKRLREVSGLSQGDLAAVVGVTPGCISRWEAGRRRPHGQPAKEYAKALRTLGELVTAEP